MAINKVEANGETLIDLTSDTATANDVIEGKTLHLASGVVAVGTYRPSDEIEARLRATVGHSSKNLLKITADTKTTNGVTFTVDKTAGTITASDTATADAQLDFQGSSPKSVSTIKNGLIYSCEGTSSNLVCAISYYNSLGAWISEQRATTSGTIISIPSNANRYKFWVRKRPAAGSDTFVFKPMLRESAISDNAFEPYQEPTDSLIETKARVYLNSTVGHSNINLFNEKYRQGSAGNLTITTAVTSKTIIPTTIGQKHIFHNFNQDYAYVVYGLNSAGVSELLSGKIVSTSNRLYDSGYIRQFKYVYENNISGLVAYIIMIRKPQTSGGSNWIDITPNSIDRNIIMVTEYPVTSDTFEPYQEPTDSLIETKARAYLTSTVGHTCKNYISYDTSTYTYTANGITFTLGPSAGTVTANGTATANTEFRIPFNHITTISGNVVYTKKPIKSGKYYFCGSPSGGTSTSYWCFVYDNTTGSGAKKWDGTYNVSRDYGDVHKNEVLIDDTHSQRFTILIANGYTASNVVFRPMIWSGDIDDDTFEPYVTPTDERIVDLEARIAALEAIINNR